MESGKETVRSLKRFKCGIEIIWSETKSSCSVQNYLKLSFHISEIHLNFDDSPGIIMMN